MSEHARIVVVGGGFAGLAAVRELKDAPVEVTLVDRHNYQTFQPLLYQVSTAALNAADVAYPLRSVIRAQANAHFRQGTVTGIDWDRNQVVLEGQEPLPFDFLVIAAGSTTNYFGIPGADTFTLPLYALADATRMRNHILARFEEADRDPATISDGALTFAVVGAGPTGVEVAGAFVELFESVLERDYPHLDRRQARVVLIDMLETVLPPFSKRSQRHAHTALRRRGVEIRLGEPVATVAPGLVRFESGEEIRTRTVVWAAGVQAADVAGDLGLEQSKGGRIGVRPDLSVPDCPHVFVAGDLAFLEGPNGDPYPQLAPVAMQQGQHAAAQILRRMQRKSTEAFRYRDKGIMATVGKRSAVAEMPGGLKLKGTIAWVAWLVLHVLFLSGVRNRLSVILNWTWSYLARDRGPRLILEPIKPDTLAETPHEEAVPPTVELAQRELESSDPPSTP